jgi:lipopolysaccharide export system permease protein
MNLLDRYLFRSVLSTCAAAVGFFIFVLVVGNAVRQLLGPLLSGELPLAAAAKFLVFLSELAAPYALPMGILTGVLLTLGRLSADSEITAMRACGIGVARLTRPVLLLGLCGAALALYVNGEAMPRAGASYNQDLFAALRANPLKLIVPKTFIRSFPGYVVYVGDTRNGQLRDFWLWQLDSRHRVVRMVRADAGRLSYEEKSDELVLTLENAVVETRDERAPENFKAAPAVASFATSDPIHLSLEKLFPLSRPADSERLLDKGWLTYGQLRAAWERAAHGPLPPGGPGGRAEAVMKVALVVADKLTSACAVFSFALIGVPLGIAVSRRETSANLGLAVLLALGYYFLTVVVSWLGRHPELRPDLLLWVPNLLLIGIALAMFRRISRR